MKDKKDKKDKEETKKHHKIKLFEDIQKITKYFPKIESFFKFENNLEYLKEEKLKNYIDILYQKYNDYEKITYFEKLKLIKNQYMRQTFKFENYYNNKALDLILLKEIQLEKEKNPNKSKKKLKKPMSADFIKKGKNKINNGGSKKESNESKLNKINNYLPLVNLNLKNNFYKQNTKDNHNDNNNKLNIQLKKKAIQIIEKLSNGVLVWMDENYNNIENSSYLELLKTNKNLISVCFDNVDDAFKYIIHNHKFREIFILSSGRLYPNLYLKLNENLNIITFLPISCIFTSFNLSKEIVVNKNKFKDIKSSFYNKGGVKTNFINCVKFFSEYSQFYNSNLKNIYNKEINKSYDGCLTFEQIYSKNQLVLPFLYNEYMENEINFIPNNEIISLEKYIQNNFKNKKIQDLILPMLYVKDFPREIVSKFFIRMYTEQTSFFSELNKSLMKKENLFDTYVKAMYEGLYIGSLHRSEDEILYRGTRMLRNEIDNMRISFEHWKKIKDKKLPQFLLYSRTFLSFTKAQEKIKYFLKQTDDNFYGIVFILKNNSTISKKYSSNADIEKLSKFPNEKEVLFFPYTTFCLKNIYSQKYDNKNCVFIELDYLGQYEYIFEQFKTDEQFQYDFINSLYFYGYNYNTEVINNNLFPKYENNNKDNNPKIKISNKFINKIFESIQNVNKNLINIKFSFSTGQKYRIQCNPNLKIKELIVYFLESLINEKNNYTINELQEKLIFIFNGAKIDVNSSEQIYKVGIINETNIVVVNMKNLSSYLKNNIQEEKIKEFQVSLEDESLVLENDLKNEEDNDWNLIFEHEDDKKYIMINISSQKLVLDAIKEYYQISGMSDKYIFIFDNKKLDYNMKICESGLINQANIFVISEESYENLNKNKIGINDII